MDAGIAFGVGFGLGLSLAAPPGPILGVSAHRTVRHGFWAGLIVTLGATVGDGTYALLMGFGVLPLLENFEGVLGILSVAGAFLMMFFAWKAWQSARSPPLLLRETSPRRFAFTAWGFLAGGFLTGYFLAISSPFNFAWWLGVGTVLFNDYGPLVFVGFFSGLVAWSLLFVALILWMRQRIQGIVKVVSYASALILVGFALFFLFTATQRFLDIL